MSSQGKNTEVVCHSILWWTAFVRLYNVTRLSWVTLQGMIHSFFGGLEKAVAHVISLVSFL